jgi:hypothetical protein
LRRADHDTVRLQYLFQPENAQTQLADLIFEVAG